MDIIFIRISHVILIFDIIFVPEFDIVEMMRTPYLFGLFLMFVVGTSFAQQGNVKVSVDPVVEDLVAKHIAYNKKIKGVDGYRVQISFESGNNSKKTSNDIRLSFIEKYPNVEAYLIYQQPNFKTRVGDFHTRLEAECFKKQIEKDFPSAFVVKDFIDVPKWNNAIAPTGN